MSKKEDNQAAVAAEGEITGDIYGASENDGGAAPAAEEGEVYEAKNKYEELALDKGWKPEEFWEGEPEEHRSAREFIDRGELLDAIHTRNQRIDKLETSNKDTMETVKHLDTMFQKSLENAENEAKAELKARKIQALDEGDSAEVVKIDEQLMSINTAPEAPHVPAEQQEIEPRITAVERDQWIAKNGWFVNDKPAQNMAVNLSESYLAANPSADGEEILKYVDSKMKENRADLFKNDRRFKAPAVAANGRTPAPRKGGKVKFPPIHALPDEVAGAAKAYVKGTGKTYEDWAAIYERAGGFEDLGL